MNREFSGLFANIDDDIIRVMKQWEDFRKALSKGCFSTQDLTEALKHPFLKTFNDQFIMADIVEGIKKTSDEVSTNYTIKRGAKIETDDEFSKITHSRFVPNMDYIKDDNRFSPKEVEWLYLAIGINSAEIEKCCIEECRAKAGDMFAIVTFEIPAHQNFKVYDLTIGADYDYEELKENFFNSMESKYQKQVSAIECEKRYNPNVTDAQLKRRICEQTAATRSERRNILAKLSLLTYSKIISENIFSPIDSEKAEKYAPFHCLAQYFLSQNYSGIIYSSTTYGSGKNLVLFDKNYAVPIGAVRKLIV